MINGNCINNRTAFRDFRCLERASIHEFAAEGETRTSYWHYHPGTAPRKSRSIREGTEALWELVVQSVDRATRGVDVVYDSVGQATFDRSLKCLRPRGMMALFGQSSGPVPPFDPTLLNVRGSLFLTRPTLAHYIAAPEELQQRAAMVFGMVADGTLTVRLAGTYTLDTVADAHRALEGRKTQGKLVVKTRQ